MKYTTSLKEETIKKLKLQAVQEGRRANQIIEELLQEYFKKERRNLK